jgi:hypothetical protein
LFLVTDGHPIYLFNFNQKRKKEMVELNTGQLPNNKKLFREEVAKLAIPALCKI